MTTIVRDGSTQWAEFNRGVFTLPNGNVIALNTEVNTAGSPYPNGDQSGVPKVYVRESSDRVNWTNRATISLPNGATYNQTDTRLTAAMYADGSISIFYNGPSTTSTTAPTALFHCKMTYSTYAVSAWETVYTFPENVSDFHSIDGHVTADGALVVGAAGGNTSTNAHYAKFFIKQTSGSSWATLDTINMPSTGYNVTADCISVTSSIVTNLSGTNYRQLHYAYGCSNVISGVTTDAGVRVYTQFVNQSTGAPYSGSVDTLQQAFGAMSALPTGNFLSSSKRCALYTWNGQCFLGIVGNNTSVLGGFTAVRFNQTASGLALDGTPGYMDTRQSSAFSNATGNSTKGIYFANGTLHCVYSLRGGATSFIYVHNITARSYGTSFDMWHGSAWNRYGAVPGGSGTIFTSFASGGGVTSTTVMDTAYMLGWFTYSNGAVSAYYTRFLHEYNHHNYTYNYVSPTTNSTVNTSDPIFIVNATNKSGAPETFYSGVRQTLRVRYAKDASFTQQVKEYVGDSNYTQITASDSPGSTILNATPPNSAAIAPGQWYGEALLQDEFGQLQSASAVVTGWPANYGFLFNVSHPMSAQTVAPAVNQKLSYGSGSVTFQWTTTDGWSRDTQTAYQVQVIRTDTNATVYDTGKVASSDKFHVSGALSSALKGVNLAWRVQTWDSGDTTNGYSTQSAFSLWDPPVVSISSPVQGATVTSPAPTITFSVTTTTPSVVASYVVTVYQNGVTVWTSGIVVPTVTTSGTVYNVQASGLKNQQNYSVVVTATDSNGLSTSTVSRQFSTAWVLPATVTGVTVDSSQYNVSGAGYISVNWTNVNQDADFLYYSIRRIAYVSDYTGSSYTFGDEAYVEVGRVYDKISAYTFRDYYAPSGHVVSYSVVQVVNRFGDNISGNDSSPASTTPVSDGYWLINPTVGVGVTSAIKLYNVTEESFDETYEEEEYNIIGRGYHVDQGQRLGYTGSLTAELRDSGGTPARIKRKQLQAAKAANIALYLRNPFGDTFQVVVKSMSFARIAGVGRNEFIDVTIPYTQVS